MNNTNQNTTSTNKFGNHNNFVEALKSSRSSTPSADKGSGEKSDKPFDFSEFMRSRENKVRNQEKVNYEYNRQETVIFNRRQEEVDKKVEAIRAELKNIAREIVHLDSSIEGQINQQVVKPGVYHVNYYEKLLSFLKNLKKRVIESRNWAALQNQRSNSKSYYWNQASQKKGGTKFSLSQERTLATQTG